MKVTNMTVDLLLTSCVMLAKGFNLREPQFSSLRNGDTRRPYINWDI